MEYLGPVRRIGVQTRSVTGTMPNGTRYESSLERDFVELIRFEPGFRSYAAQPVWVDFPSKVSGRTERYPPDGLVQWADDRKPLLVEIKYRASVVGKWRELLPKWRAAKRYAAQKGWSFAVINEDHIRGDRLYNCRFLASYLGRGSIQLIEESIKAALAAGSATPFEVVSNVCSHLEVEDGEVIPQLWRMLANRLLNFDWDTRLNMTSKIWR